MRPASAAAAASRSSAERARTLNGVLTVDQGEDVGTTIRVVAPSLRDVPLGCAADGRRRKASPLRLEDSGYELREADGDAPAVGARVEVDDREEQVIKIAPSPLPNDPRPCAYLQAV